MIGRPGESPEEEPEERRRVVARSVGAADAGPDGGEVVAAVQVQVRVERDQAVEGIAAARQDEAGDRPGRAAVAVVERVDGDELEVGKGRNGRSREVGAIVEPADELSHQLRYVTRGRRGEDHLAVRTGHAILAPTILARREEVALPVQHATVDLTNHRLVELDLRTLRQLVDELQRRSGPENLERVLAGQRLDADAIEQPVNLEIGERVALDAGRAMDGANPRPAAEPVTVHRVERQVGEEPPAALDGVEWPCDRSLIEGDVHDSPRR